MLALWLGLGLIASSGETPPDPPTPPADSVVPVHGWISDDYADRLKRKRQQAREEALEQAKKAAEAIVSAEVEPEVPQYDKRAVLRQLDALLGSIEQPAIEIQIDGQAIAQMLADAWLAQQQHNDEEDAIALLLSLV